MKLYAVKAVKDVHNYEATTRFEMSRLVRVNIGRDQAFNLFKTHTPQHFYESADDALIHARAKAIAQQSHQTAMQWRASPSDDKELNRIYSKEAVRDVTKEAFILYQVEINDEAIRDLKSKNHLRIKVDNERRIYMFTDTNNPEIRLLSAETDSHIFLTDEQAKEQKSTVSIDKINHQRLTHAPGFNPTFLLKCLEALAIVAGLALLIAGAVTANPALLYSGAAVAAAGTLALVAHSGLFSKKPVFNPNPTVELIEDMTVFASVN